MTALPASVPADIDGLLQEFTAAGILLAPDVRIAQALARLAGETDPSVLLAAALAVRATRHGSVCVDLTTIADTAVPELFEAVEETGPAAAPTGPAAAPTVLPWPEPEKWLATCATASMVDTQPPPGIWVRAPRSGARPLQLRGPLLYLDRYAQLEDLVRVVVTQRADRPPPPVAAEVLTAVLAEVFDPALVPDYQRVAVAACVTGWLTIIAGGPGTGKTRTVARILETVQRLAQRTGTAAPRVALAAPTGKAAARLAEAIRAERHDPAAELPTASTLHRLLGWTPHRARFRHDIDNRLPYDLIVVDETSMVSLELMARLMEALPVEARLVLVGDPDQLASVDAGAVLADLVARPPAPGVRRAQALQTVVPADLATDRDVIADDLRRDVVRLRTNYRFQGLRLGDLAAAIRSGDGDGAVRILRSAESGEPSIEWVERDPGGPGDLDAYPGLAADVVGSGREMIAAAERGDAAQALRALAFHRLLCAHRAGRYGVQRWRGLAFDAIAASVPTLSRRPLRDLDDDAHYVGRPLLVTVNDAGAGLFNGDTGVLIARGESVVAAFGRGGAEFRLVPLNRLPAVQTPLAMTVHKAQGSEAERVSVVLPPPESPLLTRELLYTAVTRARKLVRIIGTEESVRVALARPVVRASGLRATAD